MNLLGFIVTLVCAYYLYMLPRRWASLPLLIATTYMTTGQALNIGGLNFTEMRIMAMVGCLRVMIKQERIAGGWQTMDRLMATWGVWVVCSGLFHKDVGGTLILRSAYVFDNALIYFLFRIFLQNFEDFRRLCKPMIIILVPLAVLLLWEKLRGYNWFAYLGGMPLEITVRDGKVRAQGPFAHPILAGTVGAACLPLVLGCWWQDRKVAIIGGMVTAAMVYASASSGPIMTMMIILFGMALWLVRKQMKVVRWGAIGMVVLLSLVMQAPVYYLLAKIDLTGSSTGWHRAALIEAAIQHLGEWWIVGTDVTRHWMPTGVYWSQNHTDITNQYLQFGVLGGLPLMLLFIGILASAFAAVGRALRRDKQAPFERRFLIWTAGATLFGHATTFLSVAYFDQSIVYIYFLLGAIASFQAAKFIVGPSARVIVKDPPQTAQAHEPNLGHHC
ncbi:MAG: hypothetical protein M9920_00880 [Verrucomicrobiae bacterium]|nr:hypothetical protein [Verrucomicrobiae bacterium]